MATRKQKEHLVKVLKFTPRDIEITLSGYGGEIVMGRITEAAYDFWQDRDDLDDFFFCTTGMVKWMCPQTHNSAPTVLGTM